MAFVLFLALGVSVLASKSLPDTVLENLSQAATKSTKLDVIQESSPAELAAEVASLRSLLKDLKEPVSAMQAKAQELEKRRHLREKERARSQMIEAVVAGSGATTVLDCTAHLDCQSCFSAGCGWCIGERACVKDEPWYCQGQEDHVGSIGNHKQCPPPDEFASRRHQREENEKREEEHMQLEMQKATKLNDATSVDTPISCVMWRQTGGCKPDGPRESAKDLPCSYPVPNGNSGYCECSHGITVARNTCEHDSFTCQEKCASFTSMRRQAAERAKQKLEKRTAAELERLRTVLETENAKICSPEEDSETDGCTAPGGSEAEERAKAAERAADIRKRVHDAKNQNGGEVRPYETLGVKKDASQSDIRRAYRKLALELHPDKNPTMKDEAQMAFADVVQAFEILNNPDKRAAFDDGGHRQGFQTQWEYEQYGKQDTRGFYTGDNYIVSITERIWEKRVNDNQIWLLEFYAPWCQHCIQFSSTYKALAKSLKESDVSVGAVNCEVEKYLCASMFNIRAYPTIRMVNKRHGAQQEYLDQNFQQEVMKKWVLDVSSEWSWLFERANLTDLPTVADFQTQVRGSKDFWIVLLLDSLECAACKTAKTNIMRLSAGVAGMGRVGFLICQGANRQLCNELEVPQAPFAPQVKAFTAGLKAVDEKGELLYHPNDIEPHYALQLIERILRLSQPPPKDDPNATKKEIKFDKDKKEEKKKDPPPRPPPMWNGPKGRAPMNAVQGGGQQFQHALGQ